MGSISEAALERFKHISLPAEDEVLVEPLTGNDPYWEARRQRLGAILLAIQSRGFEETVEEILRGEATDRAHLQRNEYIAARVAAAEAVIADPDLQNEKKLQELVGIETGRYGSPGGHNSHIDAIAWILESTFKHTSDGLILKLDYTDSKTHVDPREFIGATPYKVDINNLAYYEFKPVAHVQKPTPTSSVVSADSGLYFRYAMDVRAWQQSHGLPDEPGFLVYGVHTAYEDKYTWSPYGGYGWATGEYPVKGPAVFRGQEDTTKFITSMMSFGGERLAKIKSDVADYPGFEFIHDIEPQGEIGADRSRKQAAVEA